MADTMPATDTLGARLRTRLDALRDGSVPASMRATIDRLVVRVREALDLPSRAELLELTHRLEEIDRRIAALATERVAEMARATPALPAAADAAAAPAQTDAPDHGADDAADAAAVDDAAPAAAADDAVVTDRDDIDTVPSTSTRRSRRRGGAPHRARRK